MKKTNKILSIFLAILMVISIIPITASAATYSGACGDNLTWNYDSSTYTLTISGTGEMYDYKYNNRPWESYKTKIKNVVVSDDITKIGAYAFYSFSKVESIAIPESISTIGKCAFNGCEKLTSITIPNSVTIIEERTFAYCESLTSITIPKGVTSISEDAFECCENLTDIIVDSENQYYSSDEYGVLFNNDKTILIQYPIGNTRTSYIVPEGVTTIGDSAFYNCITLTSITLPNGVKAIEDYAFDGCDGLTSIVIPDGVTTIGDWAFGSCDSLESITIPESVTTISGNALTYNTTIVYYGGTANKWKQLLDNNPASQGTYLKELMVFCVDQTVLPSGTCGDNLTWTYDVTTNTLTISGTGDMYDFEYFSKFDRAENPWWTYSSEIKNIVIEYCVTSIGEYAFYRCKNVESVTISNSVTSIGSRAFQYCTGLNTVTIGNSVTTIEKYAFYGCEGLTSVIIPVSVTDMDSGAFYECSGITNVYYEGTQEQWIDNIILSSNGSSLVINTPFNKDVTIHYNDAELPHTHNYESVATFPSTCTKQGYTIFTCSVCGHTYKDDYIPLTDHSYEKYSSKESTCTEKGYINYECSVCGKYYFEDIPKTDHSYEKYSAIEPTCTSRGYITYTCTVCEQTKREYYGETLGHSYELISTIEPTCTEQGYTTYKCAACGDAIVDNYVEATGHNCDEWVIITEPLCTKKGLKSGNCSVCGEITESIPALGHDYSELKFEYEPTCTEDGRKSKECSRCGNKTGVVIVPATGHTLGEWEQVDDAKCGEYGRFERYCSSCGQINVMSAPVDHNYSIENIVVEATCITTGSKILECSGCGKTITETIPLTDHNYDPTVTAPTCTEQGYTIYTCDCGDNYVDDYVDALGHSHTSEITTPATHTTTGVMTYTCVCGDTYTETIDKITEHNHEAVVTPPTCTEQGYTTYTCDCGDSYIDSYVDSLGHAPADAIEENCVAPTCTETGSVDNVVYCSVCDEEISRETVILEATGHADNDGDGYCDTDNELLDPSVECDHSCHKGGIAGFFWRIMNFFNKLFKTNQYCECGVAHY